MYIPYLSYNTHIGHVINKCNTLLYLVSIIKVFLSFQNRTKFYTAYILPHFDFCFVIWGNCTLAIEDKLVELQKRATRAILDVDSTLPLETMFTQLKWMTFPERVVYHTKYPTI